MWKWIRGSKKAKAHPQKVDDSAINALLQPDPTTSNTAGVVFGELKDRGYQGPFASVCDGIMCTMFHGPEVDLEPSWIESDENPFQMRILDNVRFCSDSYLYLVAAETTSAQDLSSGNAANLKADQLHRSLDNAHVESCVLGYPRPPGDHRDGPLVISKSTEELWNIFLFEGYFYFVRSLTGNVRHRAKVEFLEHALFVTEVATNPLLEPNSLYADPLLSDPDFGVRQADFLIKALLYGMECPAPLPTNGSVEPGAVAIYALMEYGRVGWHPTFEATTEYRQCLNGTQGRFGTNPDNHSLLRAIEAIHKSDSPENRRILLDKIRNGGLLIAFIVPEVELHKGNISKDTPIQFCLQEWNGQPCFFAYTDQTYRAEPSHGCIGVDGKRLAEFVKNHNENACVVINPAGPVSCKLEVSELNALAE